MKLGRMIEFLFPNNRMFFVFPILTGFLREKGVAKLPSNFSFALLTK